MRRFVPILALAVAAGCADSEPPKKPKDETPDPQEYLIPFGPVAVGESRRLTFDLYNAENHPVELKLESPPSPPFFAEIEEGLVLQPKGGASVTFRYEPSEAKESRDTAILHIGREIARLEFQGLGAHRDVRCSPDTLDFGPVAREEVAERTITCENRAPIPDKVTLGPIEGPHGANFSLRHSGFDLPLPPNETAAFAIQYNALGVRGDHEASLLVGEKRIELRARLVNGTLDVDVPPCQLGYFELGRVPAGTLVSREFTLKNWGDKPLGVSGLRTEPPFHLEPSGNIVLQPSEEKKVRVGFAPSSVGWHETELELVPSDGVTSSVNLCIRGEATAPQVVCRPHQLDMGKRPVDIPGVFRSVCTVEVPELEVRGISSTEGVEARLLGAKSRFKRNEAFVVEVDWLPREVGSTRAEIVVETDLPDEARIVIVATGEAEERDECTYSLDASPLHFGSLHTGELRVLSRKLFTEGMCWIGDVTVVGSTTFATDFATPGPWRVGDGFNFVSVAAEGGASAEGELRFTISDPDAPLVSILLRAQPGPPCLRARVASMEFRSGGATCAAVERSVRIRNECDETFFVDAQGVDADGAFAADLPTLPWSIPPGLEVQLSLSYLPDDANEHRGSLHLDGASERFVLPLRGLSGVPEQKESFLFDGQLERILLGDPGDRNGDGKVDAGDLTLRIDGHVASNDGDVPWSYDPSLKRVRFVGIPPRDASLVEIEYELACDPR